MGDLAGFASAVVLAIVALLIAWESFLRLTNPVPIRFEQAIAVAVIGLVVNLVSARLLHGGQGHHHHGHDRGHDHHHADHDHGRHGHDNNLRAAYLHVLADALTSVLAIVALLVGRSYGWLWADPAMGVVGALVIARWSWGLIRDAGGVLLDAPAEGPQVRQEIEDILAATGDTLKDLHVWQIGPGHFAAIVSVASATPQPAQHYKALLLPVHELSHVTVEVQAL